MLYVGLLAVRALPSSSPTAPACAVVGSSRRLASVKIRVYIAGTSSTRVNIMYCYTTSVLDQLALSTKDSHHSPLFIWMLSSRKLGVFGNLGTGTFQVVYGLLVRHIWGTLVCSFIDFVQKV